jgi:hypothetical protein
MPRISTLYEVLFRSKNAEKGLQNLQDETNQAEQSMSSYQRTLEQLKGRGLNSIEEASNRAKELRKEANKLDESSDEFQRMTAEAGELENMIADHVVPSINDMKKEMSRLKRARDEAMDPAEIERYNQRINQLSDDMKSQRGLAGVQDQTRRTGRSFSGLGDQVSDAAGEFGQFGQVAGDIAQGGIIAGLVAGLGAVASKFVQAADKAGRLQLKLENLGVVSEANSNEVQAQLQALSSQADVSTQQITDAAQVLSARFDSVNFEQSLDLIQRGLASGKVEADEFLTQIREYSGEFKDAGGQAERFVGFLQQAGKAGAFQDKAIDAVKEFTIRIREAGEAQKKIVSEAFGQDFSQQLFAQLDKGQINALDALQRINDRIEQVGSTAKRQRLVKELFGSPGEDLANDILVQLDDYVAKSNEALQVTSEHQKRFNQSAAASKKLAQAYGRLGKSTSGLRHELEVLGTQALAGLVNDFTDVFKAAEQSNSTIDKILNTTSSYVDFISNFNAFGLAAKAIFSDTEEEAGKLNNTVDKTVQMLASSPGGQSGDRNDALLQLAKAENLFSQQQRSGADSGSESDTTLDTGSARDSESATTLDTGTSNAEELDTRVRSGQTRSTNIRITIENLTGVEQMNVGSVEEGSEEAGELVTQDLLTALNEVNARQ